MSGVRERSDSASHVRDEPSSDDLGPLPRADGSAQLQRESIAALSACLPTPDWILRDERADDLGIDVQLEVLDRGRGTNLRSQIQLKGRSSLVPNEDGSFSVAVSTANLNYLLNGVAPMYVLYRPETKELRFAFARDELRRIEQSTADWKMQGSITIRFLDVMDASSLPRIRNRIVAEAQDRRRLHEAVAAAQVNVDDATNRLERGLTRMKQIGQLSDRESEACRVLILGGTVREIAERLGLSDNTVRTLLYSILRKLNEPTTETLRANALRAILGPVR